LANKKIGLTASFLGDEVLEAVYLCMLGRSADDEGKSHWLNALSNGAPLSDVLSAIANSPESASRRPSGAPSVMGSLEALHTARVQMVRQLPKASVIVDLGGGAIGDPRGALVVMGYPYKFEQLSIIEPPPIQRHEIYKDVPDLEKSVQTELGRVSYVYTSMADLSRFENESVDLVFAGETIEHVTLEDCKKTLREVRRVLKKSGSFCFDTPNRSVTKIQAPNAYINPDHKIEYTHAEMAKLLDDAGLKIVEVKGITHMPQTKATKTFIEDEMRQHIGMYAEYESCYMLYYKCHPKN
jgi:predicted SAM-dependent methyltransferase